MTQPAITPPEYANHPELAVVSLLFMLSRQHATGCRTLAASIAAHFRFIADDARYADILRNAAERLGMEWQGLLDAADYDGSVH
jgi:hypothetical protein